MPSDPIKAALGVATMLPCREANDRCLCHEAGALDMDTCANELPDVAAAIAAFLRALPDDATIQRARVGYSRNDFASMVERAGGAA